MIYDQFFGMHIVSGSLSSQTFSLVLAMLLGGAIGFERERRGQPAGLRTHILVCVGSALITLASQSFGDGMSGRVLDNPARIAANVVVGVGFLGAGAIMRSGTTIHGLTTAASVWTVAAIGMTVGISPRMGEVAIVATVVVLIALTLLTRVEDRLGLKRRIVDVLMEWPAESSVSSVLIGTLEKKGIHVARVSYEDLPNNQGVGMHLRVYLPFGMQVSNFHDMLREEGSARLISLE